MKSLKKFREASHEHQASEETGEARIVDMKCHMKTRRSESGGRVVSGEAEKRQRRTRSVEQTSRSEDGEHEASETQERESSGHEACKVAESER